MRFGYILVATALAVFSLGFAGCKKDDAGGDDKTTQASGHDHDHDHVHDHDHDHGHDHGEVDADDVKANLAKLSEEDRGLAQKQQVCLVGDEPLGAMGVPEKVDVDGTPIFICCAGCKQEILTNKEKYLALLAEKTGGSGSDEDGS